MELEHARSILRALEFHFEGELQHLEDAARLRIAPLIPSGASTKVAEEVRILSSIEDLECASLIAPSGQVIHTTCPTLVGGDVSGEPWFTNALQGESSIGRVQRYANSDQIVLPLAVPIFAKNAPETPVGILMALYRWNEIDRILSGFQVRGSPQSVANHFMLTESSGLVIWCYEPSEILTQHLIEAGMTSALEARKGHEGYAYETTEHGIPSFSVYTHSKKISKAHTDWLLVILHDPEGVFADVKERSRNIYLAITGLSALLLLFALRLSWSIARPIREITTAIRRFTGDNPVPQHNLKATGEAGVLANAFNEMTERLVRSKAELKSSLELKQSIIETAMAGFWLLDADNRIREVNQAYCLMSGYPEDELIGMDASTLENIANAPLTQRLAIGQEARFTTRHRRRDGSTFDVEISAQYTPTRNGRLVCFLEDITERTHYESALKQHRDNLERLVASRTTELVLAKETAEAAKHAAEKANLAKSRFLAAASHDLRQPLSALALFAGVLTQKCPPDCTQLTSNINLCIDRLNELLSDLLDISKLDAGVITPLQVNFSIDELLTTTSSIHRSEAEAKGLRLRIHGSNLCGRTDPQLLSRILSNLVANAIRYTHHGGVLIACRHHHGKQWIEVWDSGIGIPTESTDIIFEEFRQLGDESRNRGSGLGLAIVQKMAALLNLEIRVKSRPGRGSMFAIEVPTGQPSPSPSPTPTQKPENSLRIALVEDNTLVRQALTITLEQERHQVIATPDGSELLLRLGEQAPDLVISDYRLGANETGFQVINDVRTRFGASLPALIITGDTDPALIRSMAEYGITILYKPLQIDAMQTFIKDACKRRLP